MMYPVVGRSQYQFMQKSHLPIAHNILTHMDKRPPGAINKHDQEKKRWTNAR